MKQVNIHDAKTHLSKLVVDAAAAGEDIVIAKAGRPAARLVAYVEKEPSIRFGLLRGQIGIAADFDAPMPEDIVAAFEGNA